MNKPSPSHAFSFAQPLTASSPDLQALFDHIAHGEPERERDRVLPYDAVDLVRRSRLGALRLPRAEGGGATVKELFAIVIKLATADANVAHIVRNHFSVVERLVLAPQDEQSRKWRDEVLRGNLIGLASTELGTAKVGDIALATIITPDGDGYRLNGTKYYSTGSLFSESMLVRVTHPSDGRFATIIIPIKREGVELVDDWDGSGQRLTGSGTTHFHNVRVENAEVIFDTPNAGYGAAYANTFAQLFLTAINAGIVAAILRDAAALVRRRARSFYYAPTEKPADDPILQQTVGQISSNAFVAEAAVLAAAEALDLAGAAWDVDPTNTKPALNAALAASKAKIVVDELAIRSGSLLFDAGGASATKKADNLDRHWRNARTLSSHNPVTYKAQAIGAYEVNGTPLPAKGFF